MASLLPAPDDHAFADGEALARPEAPGVLGSILERLASVLSRHHQRRLSREVWGRFERASVMAPNVRLGAGARLVNRGNPENVRIGAGSVLRGIIRVERGGTLDIGDFVYIGDDTLISAASSVIVGPMTLIAHGVQILDNTSHPLVAEQRAAHWRMILGIEAKQPVEIESRPVRIGEQCWIGLNSIVLPGTTIGDRSVISAGSVVQGNVPPDVIFRCAAGGKPSCHPIAA